MNIAQVKDGDRNLILAGRITQVSASRNIQTRFGPAKIATATFEDESGKISINLWRNQIDLVKEGDVIRIENAFVRTFGGDLELNLGSDGRIILLTRASHPIASQNLA